MTENELQLKALHEQIETAKRGVELAKALANLDGNADFQKVIARGYLADEAIRLVHLRSDPSLSVEQQASVLRDIDSVGSLAEYLRGIKRSGALCERTIADAEAQIEEIEEEEVEAAKEAK